MPKSKQANKQKETSIPQLEAIATTQNRISLS